MVSKIQTVHDEFHHFIILCEVRAMPDLLNSFGNTTYHILLVHAVYISGSSRKVLSKVVLVHTRKAPGGMEVNLHAFLT